MKKTWLAALLVCGGCGGSPARPLASAPPAAGAPAAGAAAAAKAQPADDLPAGRAVDKQPPLPARKEGLLITKPSRWGRLRELASPNSNGGGYGTYWFLADGAAWAVYFASHGEGVNYLHDWQVSVPGGMQRFDAAMFQPATVDPWGLDDEAHLVAVEVNRGLGAPYWPHFVITDLTLLDGTVDASDALDDARARWQRLLVDEDAAITAELARAAQQPVGAPLPGAETEGIVEGFYPAWDESARQLRVLYVRRVVRTTRKLDPAPPCSRGNSKHECAPGRETRHGYGVEIGLEVAYGAGAAPAVTVYGPSAMTEKTLRAAGYVAGP